MKKSDLPKSVFIKGASAYLVRAEGKRRVWIRLCRLTEGLPGIYLALARESARPNLPDLVPALIAEWQAKVMPKHAAKTQKDEIARCKVVALAFADFTAEQMEPVGIGEFLEQWSDKPRSFNAYRELVRELMRFAEARGYRKVGTNPTAPIRTMKLVPRDRYITDAELAQVKAAAMVGKDEKDTRVGPMVCALVDMAYLTGQRIGDLLSLEWSQIGDEGITFKPAKTAGSTGVSLTIEWTPAMRAVVAALRGFKKRNIRNVFATQDGQPYTYWGASSAWRRACERAGVKAHFHDIRSKALTDVDGERGIGQAQRMGSHSTQTQTSEYVRHKTALKVKATR